MTITIKIRTDNASFEDDYWEELRNVLEAAAFRIGRAEKEGKLRDSNGNWIGTFTVTGMKK